MHASGVADAGRSMPVGAERRLAFLATLALLWSLLLILRLVDLQVVRHEALSAKAERQHEAAVEVRPRRGGLLDRRGRELALSTPLESIGIFASEVEDAPAVAAELAEAAGTSEAALLRRIRKGGFQWVKRLATLPEIYRVRALGRSDLHFESEPRRYYPHGSVAAHVLGTVGLDHFGQGGLEQRYEQELRGTPGLAVWFYDARQERYGRQELRPAEPGKDLVLTLDLDIQALADASLERAVHETKSEAGTVLLMDAHSGDLLAMSSWPRFNPNDLSRTAEEVRNFQGFATNRLVEPGSTFKVLTAAAALEEGLVDLEETFDCEMGATFIGRRRIRDHHPYGLLTMPEVLVKSSNVGIIKIGYRLGDEMMHSYVRRFGFGEPTGLGLPGEAHGLVRPVRRWTYSSLASLSMGQEIGVTAVQMARMFAVVANGGMRVQPRLVQAIRDHAGGEVEPPREPPQRVISADTAATMRSVLEQVVERGTGRRAAVAGYRTAGKTGTAQMINPVSRSYRDGVYMASFCGFAPAQDPVVVGVAMLYNPRGEHYYGGLVAAPLFSAVMRSALRLLDVPPTEFPQRRPRPAQPLPNTVLIDFIEGRVGEPEDSPFLEASEAEADSLEPGAAETEAPLEGQPPAAPHPRDERRLPVGEDAIAGDVRPPGEESGGTVGG